MAAPESTSRGNKKREPVMMTFAADPSLVPDFEELKAFTRQLPETDGVPLESPWHLAAMVLMIDTVNYLWRDRTDFFCGGNMFLYYSPAHVRNEDFKGPDFFYVSGVDRLRPREFWVVWEEGKYPDLIIEFLSHTTAQVDRAIKKTLYEQTFQTPEYYIYDPDKQQLEGWQLGSDEYEAMTPNERGWLWSNVLQLWLGKWVGEYLEQKGTWLRCYDINGQLVRIGVEEERQRAETEHLRADAQQRRADSAEQRAQAEQQQANSAKAELAQLKALLAEKGIVLESPEKPT